MVSVNHCIVDTSFRLHDSITLFIQRKELVTAKDLKQEDSSSLAKTNIPLPELPTWSWNAGHYGGRHLMCVCKQALTRGVWGMHPQGNFVN